METHTLNDVETIFSSNGIEYRKHGSYIMCACPVHQGEDLNCQVSIAENQRAIAYCHSVCKERFWLDEIFPEMEDPKYSEDKSEYKPKHKLIRKRDNMPTQKKEYRHDNLFSLWKTLEPLPEEPRVFPSLSNQVLNDYGWRKITNGGFGLGTGVFIPYWNEKFVPGSIPPDNTYLPFGQTRCSGVPRFRFAKDFKPTAYGKWSLREVMSDDKGERMPVILVEGTSDCLVLLSLGVPAIAMPSSSSGDTLKSMAKFCKEEQISIIYGGDNDEAGNKLLDIMNQEYGMFEICQPPNPYNDWREFHENKGDKVVFDYINYYGKYLPKKPAQPSNGKSVPKSHQKVADFFGVTDDNIVNLS